MHLAGRSSLASHDRQRREMEVQPGRVAVGSLWKPSWEWVAEKGRSEVGVRYDAGSQQPGGGGRRVVGWCVYFSICQR